MRTLRISRPTAWSRVTASAHHSSSLGADPRAIALPAPAFASRSAVSGPATVRAPSYRRAHGNPDRHLPTSGGTLVVTTAEIESVCSGCQSPEPCLCVTGREALNRRAQALTALGIRAARVDDFRDAERLLSEAVTIEPTLAHAWEARGLAAFARGDARVARVSWSMALQADLGSRAGEWLQSLETGALRNVLDEYNDALSQAKAGRRDQATRALERARALCPEFAPATRLQRLLSELSDSPDLSAPLSSATTTRVAAPAAAVVRTRLAWTAGLLAAAMVVLAGWSQLSPRWTVASSNGPDAAPQTRDATTPVADSIAALRRALGLVLAASPDSLAAVIETTGVDPVSWPASAVSRASELRRVAARKHYLAGQAAFRRGDDKSAISELKAATGVVTRGYFEDDALYLLMLAEERAGNATAARGSAATLLRRFGSSIYANSRTRRLAGDVRPTANR